MRAVLVAVIVAAPLLAGCIRFEDAPPEPTTVDSVVVDLERIVVLASHDDPDFPPSEPGQPAAMRVGHELTHVVQGRLLVRGQDDAQALAGRLDGTADPLALPAWQQSRAGATGDPLWRVVFEPTPAAPETMVGLLERLDPERGWKITTDATTLGLLVAQAQAVADGFQVSLDWLGEGHLDIYQGPGQTFFDDESLEAPGTLGGDPVNAWEWPGIPDDDIHTIGVGPAWRTLEGKGLLDNEVRIAIIDGGFDASTDLDGEVFGSAVGELEHDDVEGTPNFGACGGNPCPWHGYHVAHTAMGIPDDLRGVAGPAGPFASPILIFTDYSQSSTITALGMAQQADADIISMSYGGTVPFGAWTGIDPLEEKIATLRGEGRLLFASAGNDGNNVDAVECWAGEAIGVHCHEESWKRPCENNGVLCVGGLATTTTSRAANSNYAVEAALPQGVEPEDVARAPGTVDLWAPYTLRCPADPDDDGPDRSRSCSGTSVSTPFAAGIAAMIWAAHPGWSADQVEAHLFATARQGPAGPIVQAQGAMVASFCPEEPDFQITSPIHQSHHDEGDTIDFAMAGTAAEPVSVLWKKASYPETEYATTPAWSKADFDVGLYTITASVTDVCGQRAARQVQFYVDEPDPSDDIQQPPAADEEPVVEIVSPDDGTQYFSGDTIHLSGEASDAEDGDLSDQIKWTLIIDGGPIMQVGTGARISYETASGCGSHVHEFWADVTDSAAQDAEDLIQVSVVGPC